MYTPTLASRTETVAVRGLPYQVRRWGTETASQDRPLVLLHGWMDVSASYQFVIDALGPRAIQSRMVIAPDWRGFGGSMTGAATDHYLFADYLADLDALLHHYCGTDTAVDMVGHSMGGNAAMLYAGVRPRRVRRLVNLEGYGMPAGQAGSAPRRYAAWLDDLQRLARGELALKTYDSVQGVAERLMKTNRRLTTDKALWLAHQWAAPGADGRWRILGNAAHKVSSSQVFRVEEVLAVYAAIEAPVLAVDGSDDSLGQWWQGRYSLAEYHERLRAVPDCRLARIEDAGHMLHHDQPQAVAELIAAFLALPR
ncbi:alpha/beta hydrolase [Corticibacter populi]|uniref:Alpha/beta hydrolase n=1 Tax=Corticibacter populi TaxID=1550736 RepID=A0A3M6QM19_9BURK|nr:alpha/beta hydrolase [Corticibacter populi]RMX04084.1 alpha/beta hydrolase [Corticibacter populi]RZS33091.1 pimeloyl-ACP methyl ester carboxylesterase [Corticibacter populi]